VEIAFHKNGASVSDTTVGKIEKMIADASAWFPRPMNATVRFTSEGVNRRVEIRLRAPRHTALVATGEGRYFGPAASQALQRLRLQLVREKHIPKARSRVQARRAGGAAEA
jgi:ribosome-associated translation inhibitor RaiA